ncbi:MAG: hypothetical protein AVDCRST_MAG25-3733, partial [uncultured Rubrobacteraceae bacterium]
DHHDRDGPYRRARRRRTKPAAVDDPAARPRTRADVRRLLRPERLHKLAGEPGRARERQPAPRNAGAGRRNPRVRRLPGVLAAHPAALGHAVLHAQGAGDLAATRGRRSGRRRQRPGEGFGHRALALPDAVLGGDLRRPLLEPGGARGRRGRLRRVQRVRGRGRGAARGGAHGRPLGRPDLGGPAALGAVPEVAGAARPARRRPAAAGPASRRGARRRVAVLGHRGERAPDLDARPRGRPVQEPPHPRRRSGEGKV